MENRIGCNKATWVGVFASQLTTSHPKGMVARRRGHAKTGVSPCPYGQLTGVTGSGQLLRHESVASPVCARAYMAHPPRRIWLGAIWPPSCRHLRILLNVVSCMRWPAMMINTLVVVYHRHDFRYGRCVRPSCNVVGP